ncbi:ABC-type transport system involved in multi-copper enzyme maturation, permease component [Oceanobacillus picturae]|uniref:ABC-type transport system involved in multi-copper enzyme maturation, permease component n=2 Tax=Oceanobacillus picturae TaxID=171693 RepID=W9AFP0_9BACI|nr:ABC-type transport system involved in multi-copper enzyme maturation, permease component [Oceanobacillus picturae]
MKCMRNTLKVAKWEIKRNMKNKSYLIGLVLTPLLIIGFMVISSLFDDSEEETADSAMVFVNDQLDVYDEMARTLEETGISWNFMQTDLTEAEAQEELENSEETAYIFVDQEGVEEGALSVYTSDDMDSFFMSEVQILTGPIQSKQMEELGLTDAQLAGINQGVQFVEAGDDTAAEASESSLAGMEENPLQTLVPGIFGGFVLLSVVFTGMAIFQSASQEKKDKIAEIILSSLTPTELMQGKIIGYFALGLIQTLVSTVLLLPVLMWRLDEPLLEYLLVPELALYLLIAILGYLLFASIFVGIGATMADVTTAGNFQGFVMMLPFLPFVFIGPVLSDPSGLMAQIGTYIPFTSPAVLLLRLTTLEEWPWIEIGISLAILAISVWAFMKLAGKIFKVGILMYGKNATPGEIIKWLKA